MVWMRVEWVTEVERLAEIERAWDQLAGPGNPFMSAAWLGAWRRGFAAELAPHVGLVWRGEELVAGLPLLWRDGRLEPMANDHSPSFAPLARDRAALEEVTAAALRACGGTLALPAVPGDHALLAAGRGRWRALTSPDIVSPVIDLGGTYAQWREATRKRWQAPLERLGRKMARDHSADLRLVERPAELEAALSAGFALEAAGWKGGAGTAILSARETATFYGSLAEAFHARGELRTSSITLDGRLAAFELALVCDGRLYKLKNAYDESLRRLAPGLVLHLKVIERCFELGLDACEILGDRADWKAKFATSERPYVRWTGYDRGGVQTGRYVTRRGRRAAGAAVSRLRVRG
jgi:CelD/BcsL family acetyltransferase involved in cellulose biosynthesis